MKTPYTNSIRHGMPKSRNEQDALYEGIVRGLVLAGLISGALMVLVQFFMWASNLDNPNLRMTTTIEARK